MLSIQPKFTTSAASKIAFKADDADYVINESKYNEKKAYYEDKKNDFENSIGDKYIPGRFKKVLRGGVAVSEGVLEGWAVTWALIKSAEFLKDGYNKLDKNKAGHILVESVKFVGKTFKKAGSLLANAVKAIAKPFKKMTYVKSTNALAVTLGVGCGVMGTYNALKSYAKKDAENNAKVQNKTNSDNDSAASKVEKNYAEEVDELNEEIAGE